MDKFLQPSEYIDWHNKGVLAQAQRLAYGEDRAEVIAKKCFEFVRDEIKHSWDFQLNPVTCKASDVLAYGTGYCYAKSHLLAALLRANKIPAGLCYQRTTVTDKPPFCLHGLNAIYLESYGWYRVDARGNKEGVNADFCPPREQLAFALMVDGEADLPEIWSEPLPSVVGVLNSSKGWQEVSDNLPDIELW